MKYVQSLIAAVLATTLVACGGGSPEGAPSGAPGAGAPGTPTTSPSGAAAPSAAVSIVNQSGANVSSISVGGAFVVRAVVRDATGALVGGKLVTFELGGSSIATIDPATALTNGSGVAEVAIAPATLTSKGAASVTAKMTVNGQPVSNSVDFSVSAASLTLSNITVGSASLPSGGNTSVQVTALVDGQAAAGVPVNITYTASCGRINGSALAGGVSVTTDGAGVASAVYSAVKSDGSLCSGAVTLSATSAGALAPKSLVLTVALPIANAVTFVSALPAQIFVAGSGAVDQAIVRFRILSSGEPLANVAVNFSIQTNPGGVAISATSATTDQDGIASVTVSSGTIPGPVRLKAELASNSSVFAESQNLTVASGPPSQRFMSLSVETFNIEGQNIDGVSTRLTARIADRQGNAVQNGTVVNFTSEGGQVASSCATLQVNGISSCSVNFVSQNSRPTDGRVSVLAYTEGTKDYIDSNSNNRFDSGVDVLRPLGDPFRDDDENGLFESVQGEFLIPRGGTEVCVGAGAPFPSRTDSCDQLLQTTVRQQATILFSSSEPVLKNLNKPSISVPVTKGTGDAAVTTNVTVYTGVGFNLGSKDHPNLPMPAGTRVEVAASNNNSADGFSCAVTTETTGTPIPNVSPGIDPFADLATPHSVGLKECVAGDSININVIAPSGLKTTFSIPF